jgi:hypothetical protein
MSKLTFLRRIALASILALALGGLSSVPSQAIVLSNSVSFDASDAVKTGESATATLTHVLTGTSTADSATIRVLITSSNAGNVGNLYMLLSDSSTNQTTATTPASPTIYFGNQGTSGAAATFNSLVAWNYTNDSATMLSGSGTGAPANWDSATVQIGASGATTATTKYTVGLYNIKAAGTYTVKAIIISNPGSANIATSSVEATWTVTVTEADKTASASSTATLRQYNSNNTTTSPFNGTREGSDSSTLFVADGGSTDTTPEAQLYVLQKSASGTNIAAESFTVTVTGEAWVTTSSTSLRPTSGNGVKSLQFAVPTAGTAVEVRLWSTGTAGTATVNVTAASGTAIGSAKTLTFAGDVTTLTVAATYKKIIRSGVTTGTNDVLAIKATDAGGRAVKGLTISGVSGNLGALISGTTCTDERSWGVGSVDVSTRDGVYLCSVTQAPGNTSGAAVTMTWRTVDPAVTTSTAYLTVTSSHTLGGGAHRITLSTDKATYEPGEKMTITATATDSSGNPVYDYDLTGMTLNANKNLGASISMSRYFGGKSSSNSIDVDGAVLNSTNLFAPAAAGKFLITGSYVDAAGVTQIATVEAKVSDDASTAAASAATDAALEAIDAANAATDAANLAAEAADAATVAAEEARDAADAATAAVEALATEVATLMAALKAQITTLANTVAKIAKKVKA